MHAVDPKQVKANALWLTQDEICKTLQRQAYSFYPNSTKWVTFSGGNPCIHDLTTLVNMLREDGWMIAVETQGTLAPAWLHRCNIITISPKGPGMGENTDLNVLDEFIDRLGPATHKANLKVVIFDARDLEFAKMIYERYLIVKGLALPFFLSQGNPYPPGYFEEEHPDFTNYVMLQIGNYKYLFDQIKNDPLLSKVRLLPQFHSWLWGNEKGK
jgi:7-carboxy-7-deazaguanine synthase